MTQPLCQARILTPENDRSEPPRVWLDPAEPDLLRTACCHRRELPPPDAPGFDLAGGEEEDRQAGPGLLMMDGRANRPGGTLTVRPGPGGTGTLVACVFDPAPGQDHSVRTA